MPSLQLANELRARFGDLISEPKESRNEVTIQVGDPERIADVMAVAKKDFGFDFLKDISSVDNLGSDPRWTVVYHLYGLQHGGARSEDAAYLTEIAHNIQGRTVCAFGEAAAWPVLSYVKKFHEEFEK